MTFLLNKTMNPDDRPVPETISEPAAESGDPRQTPLIVNSQQLFLGRSEIWIEHAGERYRLRITRRGRLILQK